ncbi:fructooligosaccharide transport system substrate-binding protein [Fictibacillus solisalsi]|uniref:Fructooligosaccharide transport system substrate-binding protein n=1 Tax=Fictibacillus solisalsi TaxID=459525 RepID=A0A1H0B0K5_9BACL|nr:sugar ABC transporter substrate-binding protein [Fictibacillus solisalsi]SDN39158.1 fructooligosaccharide transport system substrate-binding protein [Fictibacillus solisalsi]
MKKGVLLLFCLIFAFSMAGCSNDKQGASGSEKGGEVKLKMWAHQGQPKEVDFYKKRIDEFNKEHKGKINVKLDIIPSGTGHAYEDKINAAATSNGLPDVLDMDGPFVGNYAATGILSPIDDYVEKSDKQDFAKSIIQQGTYDGKLYALGAMESSIVVFYNKKLLKEAGIQAPETLDKAWTWDQFMEASKKLTKGDVRGLTMHMDLGVGEWLTYMGSVFVWSNDGLLLNNDRTKAEGYLNGPESVEALNYVKGLFKSKVVSVSNGPADFEEGKAAMMIGGVWLIPGFEDYKNLDWEMTYFPYSKKKVSPSGSWAFGVSSQSQHPKEAAEVVKWMSNKDSVIEISKITGMPPARESAFKEIKEYDKLPKKVIKDQVLNTAKARPATPAYPVLSAKFAEAFQAAALGQDVKQELDKAAKDTDRELERFKK